VMLINMRSLIIAQLIIVVTSNEHSLLVPAQTLVHQAVAGISSLGR